MQSTKRKREDFKGQQMVVLPEKIINRLISNNITKYLFVTDIGYFPEAEGHFRQRKHGSMQNILVYCTKGTGWISLNGKRSELNKNQFCYIPAGTPHTYASGNESPWSIYWIHFSGEHSERFMAGYGGKILHSVLSPERKEMRKRLFGEILQSLTPDYSEKNLEYSTIVLRHYLASFRYEQQFSGIREEDNKDQIACAIDYMKNHLTTKLSLKDISEECMLSVSHFCLVFKRATTYTPVEYLNHLRIQKACHMLDFTSLRIADIAAKTGFSDTFYFSRVFRKNMGLSPREYRKQKSG